MRALSINFAPVRHPWRWLSYLLLLVALLASAYGAKIYIQRSKELSSWERSWRQLKKVEHKKSIRTPEPGDLRQMQAELKAANKTISKLALPWDALFREIETTMSDQVALLSIEPDTERKELRISAEAKDFEGMLGYTRQLNAIAVLQSPYVMSHQIQSQDPQRPVRFVVVAKWLITPGSAKND